MRCFYTMGTQLIRAHIIHEITVIGPNVTVSTHANEPFCCPVTNPIIVWQSYMVTNIDTY